MTHHQMQILSQKNKSFNEPLKLMTFILSYNFLNSKLIAALKDICQ